MVPGLGDLNYRERLGRLGLFSLGRGRPRDDIIELHEITRSMDTLNAQSFYPPKGDNSKIRKLRLKERGVRFKRDHMATFSLNG